VRLLPDGAQKERQIVHVQFHEFEPFVLEGLRQVRPAPELHVIDAEHGATALEQTIDKMAANEACRARD
jgi:hypothetical protein